MSSLDNVQQRSDCHQCRAANRCNTDVVLYNCTAQMYSLRCVFGRKLHIFALLRCALIGCSLKSEHCTLLHWTGWGEQGWGGHCTEDWTGRWRRLTGSAMGGSSLSRFKSLGSRVTSWFKSSLSRVTSRLNPHLAWLVQLCASNLSGDSSFYDIVS